MIKWADLLVLRTGGCAYYTVVCFFKCTMVSAELLWIKKKKQICSFSYPINPFYSLVRSCADTNEIIYYYICSQAYSIVHIV